MESRNETRNFQAGRIDQLTQNQIACKVRRELIRDRHREAVVRGQQPLNQRMKETMDSLASQIALLTEAVAALTQAVQENTQAMTAPEEEEEVAQTGGLLGTVSDDEPESPHL